MGTVIAINRKERAMNSKTTKETPEPTASFTVSFPRAVLDQLDEDAKRCGRSRVKHVEKLITSYLGLEDVELSREGFERMAEADQRPLRRRA